MRKVLLIVLMQLVVTAGVSLVFYYVMPLKARLLYFPLCCNFQGCW